MTSTHRGHDQPGAARGTRPRRAESAAAAAAAGRLLARIADEELADVTYGPVDSPFGTLHAAVTRRGLVRLAFPEEQEPAMVEQLSRRHLAGAIVRSPRPLDELRAGARRVLRRAPAGRSRSSSTGS